MAGRYLHRSARGPSGSISQRGTLRITPGIATGVTDEPLKHPALPNDAPSPGLPGSIRNTLWPSRCSQLAAHTPTMPAPITPTRPAALAAIACSTILGRQHPGPRPPPEPADRALVVDRPRALPPHRLYPC